MFLVPKNEVWPVVETGGWDPIPAGQGGTMARPIIGEEAQRTERVNLRVTAAERMTIEANAAFHGITPSEYVRRRALAQRMPTSRAEKETAAARSAALIRIGNNLNQLTRHANAGRGIIENELLLTLARINGELDRLYDPAPG